jgi:hypothetical protein
VFLLLIAGLMATFTGPAVAVLVLPREITVNAGGATYYVNSSVDNLWPSTVGLEHYFLGQIQLQFNNSLFNCSSNMGYASALCPSGGFSTIRRYFSSNFLWLYPNTTETLTFAGIHYFTRPLFIPSGDGGYIHSSESFLPLNRSAWTNINVTSDWLETINFQIPPNDLEYLPQGNKPY